MEKWFMDKKMFWKRCMGTMALTVGMICLSSVPSAIASDQVVKIGNIIPLRVSGCGLVSL